MPYNDADTGTTHPQRSPLAAEHEAAGASFTDFGGWLMPLRYTSDLAEHRAVREAVGLFDISHMAEFAVTGPEAAPFLDYALASAIGTIPPTRAKYSLLLAADGGIIDDLIVYHPRPGEYLVVANAANHDPAWDALVERAAGFDADVTDRTRELALIAVQGPRSLDVLHAVSGLSPLVPAVTDVASAHDFASLKYYSCIGARFGDAGPGEAEVLVARTGYTGEDGFELYVPVSAAIDLWQALLAAGEPFGITRCGLAARDTLRLEAGMPLYGHELSHETLPEQAGLGRVVAFAKPDFVGKAALEDAAARRASADDSVAGGPSTQRPVLVGLVGEGRRAARAGYVVLDSAGNAMGEVTSGVLSPTLGYPIAMAYVRPDEAVPGTVVGVDVRGTRMPMTVVALPFYKRSK